MHRARRSGRLRTTWVREIRPEDEEESPVRLQGKVALVTGGDRGIGRAITERFAAEGANVVINYARNEAEANKALEAVEASGRQGLVVQADMSRVVDVTRLVDEAVARFGNLDILVNNAGVETDAPFLDATEPDFDKVIGVNLKGAFFTTQAFARHLVASKRPGKVITISSVHEEIPFPNYASYCASKGGIKMLTRDLAIELGPRGITVNAIAPGAIATDINKSLLADKPRLDALLKKIPLGRMGKPEDVAAIAAFLASADADYVTGSTYFVDGGLTWSYQE